METATGYVFMSEKCCTNKTVLRSKTTVLTMRHQHFLCFKSFYFSSILVLWTACSYSTPATFLECICSHEFSWKRPSSCFDTLGDCSMTWTGSRKEICFKKFKPKCSYCNAHIVMLIFFRNAKGFSVLNLTLQHFNCLDSLDDNIGLLQTLCSF